MGDFRSKSTLQETVGKLTRLALAYTTTPEYVTRRRAMEDSADYIEQRMGAAASFPSHGALLKYAIRQVRAPGCCMEFGVYKGESFRMIGKAFPDRKCYGFDSFKGLPEAWDDQGVGAFDLGGKLPKVTPNAKLYPGWFADTLPKWKAEHSDRIAFLHVDCDLYSATKTIFDEIGDRLEPGAIILFDEYLGYRGWRDHEFKAWQEFIQRTGRKYDYLGFGKYNVAVRLI